MDYVWHFRPRGGLQINGIEDLVLLITIVMFVCQLMFLFDLYKLTFSKGFPAPRGLEKLRPTFTMFKQLLVPVGLHDAEKKS